MAARPPVDELRDRLRELGYLDAGLDRFVLAPARAGRSARSLALRASLRIGLLVGLVLGVSSAIAIAVRIPSLVTGVRDLAVLAAYLSTVAVVASAALALVVVLSASRLASSTDPARLARRARPLARAAGITGGVAALVYLTLWWRTFDPFSGEHAVWATLAALVVAVVTSLVLGHTMAATTLAVTSLHDTQGLTGRGIRLSRRSSAVVAFAALVASGSWLFVSSRPARPPELAPLVVVPTGVEVTLLAIDGFEPALAARAAGRLSLDRIRDLLNAPSAELSRDEEDDPARVWTTIATGLPASRHGVTGLEVRRVAGLEGRMPTAASRLASAVGAATDLLRLTRPVAGSAQLRLEPTFWEVGARAGLRTAALNWWATWPALDGDGLVITDRAALRLERGGTLSDEIVPSALYEPLRLAWPRLQGEAARQAGVRLDGLTGETRQALERSAIIDGTQVALATSPLLGDTDVMAVYLPGLDIARDALVGGRGAPGTAADLASRLEGLERYYALVDDWIGAFRDTPHRDSARGGEAPARVLFVLAYPGRSSGRTPAHLYLASPGPDTGVTLSGRLEDVAPTLLWAVGVPVSRAVDGRPLTGFFRDPSSPAPRWAVREVPSWGVRARPASPPSGQPTLDEEMRERLRSLGYVR